MAEGKGGDVIEVEFRGHKVPVSLRAAHSVKVQKGLGGGSQTTLERSFWALDQLLCGKSDELFETIPEADGRVGEMGISDETLAALMAAVMEAANAKN